MTQYANRKETWWEIPTLPAIWAQNYFSAEKITIVEPITLDESLSQYFVASELTLETVLFSSLESDFDLIDEPIRYIEIEQSDIPQGEPYKLKKNIQAVVERESDTDFIATFRAGNVSIGAETFRDARQWLVLEILDTFDALIECGSNLGPDAARQLNVLSDYIAKTDRATR